MAGQMLYVKKKEKKDMAKGGVVFTKDVEKYIYQMAELILKVV